MMIAHNAEAKSNPIKEASDFYPNIKERWASKIRVSSDSEASSLSGFDVRFPARIPTGYKLELAVVDPTIEDNKYVYLFYSRNCISESMRIDEFFAWKGILVIYHKASLVIGSSSFSDTQIRFFIKASKDYGTNAYEVTINGHRGIVFSERDRDLQGFKIHDPSQVDFIADDTYITLQAFLPETELIQIAESIPI